jgi:hypothetical protein
MVLAAAAGFLLAVAVTGWALFHKRVGNLIAETAVLDLRDRSPARGAEMNPAEPPLEIARSTSHLKIYLPLGSSEGDYDIRISASVDKILFTTKAAARKQGGVTSLAVDIGVSSASPGLYVLQIKKPGFGWTSYPLQVK